MTLSVTAWPGATAVGRAVRRPSQTKSVPACVYRWYEALNAPGCQVVVFTGVCMPWPENQVTPSCTMSYRSLYVPGVAGTAICASRAAICVRAVPASGVRRPFHSRRLPAASYQW